MKNSHDDLMRFLNQAQALATVATTAKFSEMDDATVFHYFDLLDDLIYRARSTQ